jgi:hypothetical protein
MSQTTLTPSVHTQHSGPCVNQRRRRSTLRSICGTAGLCLALSSAALAREPTATADRGTENAIHGRAMTSASSPFKTGTYREGALLAYVVNVRRTSFTITAFFIRSEQCTPTPPQAVAFQIGLRGGRGTIKGTISHAGRMSATAHLDGVQQVTGHIKGTKLTMTVSDRGTYSANGNNYTCHGAATVTLTRSSSAGSGGGR